MAVKSKKKRGKSSSSRSKKKKKSAKSTKRAKFKAKKDLSTGKIVEKPQIHEAQGINVLEQYDFLSENIPITIRIIRTDQDLVPIYEISVSTLSKNTELFLERIRGELIEQVNLGIVEITDMKNKGIVEEKFKEAIAVLIKKYFPDIDTETNHFLSSYLLMKTIGLGKMEMLLDDPNLEEISINSSDEPIWVYHRRFGWLKTNEKMENEDQIRHYASVIGRKTGRQISNLNPLMDTNLETGDRVNATLMPLSTRGNTITLRKFASKPWTITDFIRTDTISVEAAALIWTAVHYELSVLISGGTASGKTSMLNCISNFFPPNQRIISIEDTREIKLPQSLHWVPMLVRLPNPEGRGGVSMLDLLVNALRQRPDRIIVGEIRREEEAQVLFEAIHTGHSVYATVHANDVEETITRLTNPPINVPLSMLPAISMVVVQYRNRRTGARKTFQIAEIKKDGKANVLEQYDAKKDSLQKAKKSVELFKNLQVYTGLDLKELQKEFKEKEFILRWLVENNINAVDDVGKIISDYYSDKKRLIKMIKSKNKTG